MKKSIEIIKQYNVKLLNSNRLGAGGARNKGLDIASGKYIILLDGDDYLYKNDVLEKLDKKLNNQDIVFVKYKQILGEEEKNTSTIDNYTIRKALDFTIQTLEYLYLADKYKDKKQFLMNRISQEKYLQKISKLIDWVENDKPYKYEKFLKQ